VTRKQGNQWFAPAVLAGALALPGAHLVTAIGH
jgi:hypothetical protein